MNNGIESDPTSQLPPEVLAAALALRNYHRLDHQLLPADGIIVFGSNDLRVASHAADLVHAGLAPWILFSGARGRMTEDWPEIAFRVSSPPLGLNEYCTADLPPRLVIEAMVGDRQAPEVLRSRPVPKPPDRLHRASSGRPFQQFLLT